MQQSKGIYYKKVEITLKIENSNKTPKNKMRTKKTVMKQKKQTIKN